jgi:hypothetical protein
VDSGDLTIAQAEKRRDALIPHLRYLFKMKQRMERTGFPPNDDLYRQTVAAYDAAQSLTMTLHYLSCKSGVGRAPRESPKT